MNDTFKGLPIKQLILIDPYIVPKDKRINLVPVLHFLIENTVSGTATFGTSSLVYQSSNSGIV